ncbi:unnamed protein product [Darwinula stevensoni]|uniref:MPN domain-containing protein n=1 Tax=Darwinula stevensoni TaxID=69355 RepID=A0A7R9AGM0_9CRUS|nr:unnamed protein product [Darwinula stevensoni]CAG0903544.1 unnamed protein product [Darwinula stevensoni]
MYYQSGREMLRMARIYQDEGALESAYFLFLRYITLFLEKILMHPGHKEVSKEVRHEATKSLKSIIPIAEELKKILEVTYQQDYEEWLKQEELLKEERKRKEEEEAEQKKRAEQQPIGGDGMKIPADGYSPPPSSKGLLDDGISYDFLQAPTTKTPTIDRQDTQYSSCRNLLNYTNDMSLKPSSCVRRVVLPSALIPRFMSLAEKNTKANKETCGVLAGKLAQNCLRMTHLLLPQQEGGPDSCITRNEELLFDYQDRYDLLTLGWIHTHPSQTAFLSSVDLHTHSSYQLLLPDAIAVVVAPKHQQRGVYSLTEHGMRFLTACHQQGFHTHPSEPPLYKEASHVEFSEEGALEVADFRR